MAGKDGTELVGKSGQCLVQRHAGSTRVGKESIHTMMDQRLNEDIRSRKKLGRRELVSFFHDP